LLIEGNVSNDDYSGNLKMRAEAVHTLDDARQQLARGVCLSVSAEDLESDFAQHLQLLLSPYRSEGCRVRIDFQRADAKGQIMLGDEWQVKPTDELIQRLKETYGRDSVQLVYR
jgi:DNA polymerase-3 subunit alpha